MKIAMIADSIYGNGIGITVFRLYRSLVQQGYKCDIICYQDLNKCPDIVQIIKRDGNSIYSIPSISKGPFSYIKNLRKIFRKNKYDVVHIHTSLLIFLAAFAAKKENIKCRIGHAHGAKFFNYPELIVKILEPIGRMLNKKYCTGFVTCSQVSALYTFGCEAVLIPNYTPKNEIMDISINTINEYKEKYTHNGTITFGYMGSLDGIKNVIFLPYVISELNKLGLDSELLIVGEGKMLQEIKQESSRLGCKDKVQFLGKRDDCRVIVQVFDYYISASTTEGMSLSMIEAQMSGKPCIVSALIPDYSDLGIKLFRKVEGFDPRQWATIIKDWISNGYTAIDREKAIKKIDNNGLGEDSIIKELTAVYENCEK